MNQPITRLPSGDFERQSILFERLALLRQERYAAVANGNHELVIQLDDRIHVLLKKFE